jgi:ketosteroid isomerase-like protein
MDEAERRELIARYVAAYNRFDVDGMLALLTDDVRFENVSGGQVTASAFGAAEFRALAERASALFSEREQRVTGVQFRGGVAVASITYHGVLAADVPGGPPAGSMLELVASPSLGSRAGASARSWNRS